MDWWMNGATVLAYIFLTFGVIFQIKTLHGRKTADDIETKEVVGRFIAQVLIMWKMIVVADLSLIVGHATLTVIYAGYFYLVLKYKYSK